MALTVLDIATAPDFTGKYRAEWVNFGPNWSDKSIRDYAAGRNKDTPRRFHVVEVSAARMEEIRSGNNLGYATSPGDPDTAAPVEKWEPMA